MKLSPYFNTALIVSASLWSATLAIAQNEGDVQRLSSQYMPGTARFTGLGGAMGSLGGDMSAITVNPAGVGIYRFGDVSFTPAVEINEVDAAQQGNTKSETDTRFVINNGGLVLANELNHPYWKMLNFGVTYQRLNTFNDQLSTSSINSVDRSLVQDFIDEANGYFPSELSEFSAGLAYDAYVIDTLDHATSYTGRGNLGGDLKQQQTSERRGNTSDFSISLGANYNDFLYIGAAVGIQSVKYNLEVSTKENVVDETTTDLREYTLKEELATDGIGVNFKVGAIVKIGKVLRVGGSIHTPTSYSLTDDYKSTLTSHRVNPNEHYNLESSLSVFEYRIRTPWRYMASISGVFKKRALLSAQYEYANFSFGKLKNTNSEGGIEADFSDANHIISNEFEGQHTLRGGLEIRATKSFYIRSGIAYFTNTIPANEFTNADLDRIQYSCGLGIKKATWNLDLSYQLSKVDELYYTNRLADLTTLHNNYQSIALTFGIRL